MAGVDEIPLPEGMEPIQVPAVAVPTGPLPYNYKVNPAGGYDKFGYSHTAVAKSWRAPTEKLITVVERPSSDHLFDNPFLSKQPDELLNPPPLTKEDKQAKRKRKAAGAEPPAEDH